MKLKKKIFILGPIGDFGGREIEVKNITNVLLNEFQVNLISTIPMTKNSVAVVVNDSFRWSTIEKEIFLSNVFIMFSSLLYKFLLLSKEPAYRFVGNKLNKRFFSFNNMHINIIRKEINRHDLLLFCGELTSKYLKEAIDLCKELNKPIIIRTTGKIKSIPDSIAKLLKDVNLILVHSSSNLKILLLATQNNISVLDQTTLLEEELINIKISNYPKKITYGYLGRFSKEKGIIELLNLFERLDKKLIVAGNGPLLKDVKKKCERRSFLDYVGEVSGVQVVDFFKSIDVLIIPSFEESGPLVGIEAMAAGKIIISTKVGAMLDRLQETDNQFWFNIEKEQSLVKVISEIETIDKASLVNIRKSIRTKYISKYSRKQIGRKYLDVILKFSD